MKSPESRHYTEEELLLHVLGEDTPEMRASVESHLAVCGQCKVISQEYRLLVSDIRDWTVEEPSEESWEVRKRQLMQQFLSEQRSGSRMRWGLSMLKALQSAWRYALENPLPTMGYIAVAIAFALERTVTVFRLDRILPATSEVFEIIRQVL